VFTQKSSNVNGPRKIEKAKIGLIQFCISPPKTDVSNTTYIIILSLINPMSPVIKLLIFYTTASDT